MSIHVFKNHCLDFDALLQKADISHMLKVCFNQSKDPEAKRRMDVRSYKDVDATNDTEWSPAYFGMFGEWLAQHFFEHYGHIYNIHGVVMTDSEGSTEEDYGIDGR
jgi:hypothetical protein